MITQKLLKKLASYILFATFFVPLVIAPSFLTYPFIVPKALVYRSLILLIIGLLVPVLISNISLKKIKNIKFNKTNLSKVITNNNLTIVISLFALSTLISTFTGVDSFRSFWGNPERMMGSFTYFHYIALFFIAIYLFTKFSDWQKLSKVFSVPAILVISIGIIQKIFPNFLYNRGAGEVISTLGNPIYLAGYGLFVLYLGLLSGIYEKGKLQKYFFGVSLLGFIAIVISGTRGTLLAAIVSLFIIGCLYVVTSDIFKKIKQKLFSTLALLIILAFGFIGVHSNLLIKGTAKTRVMAWKIAVTSVKDHPIFGWGPNNFYYAFNQYYNPQFLIFGFKETWFDNAHNVMLNVLSEQGIVGLLLYLSIFIIASKYLYQIFKKDKKYKHISILGFGYLIGHVVHNLFVFENLTSLLYLYLFLAFIVVMHKKIVLQKDNKKDISNKHSSLIIVSITVVISILAIITTNINVAIANNHGYHARGLFSVGEVDKALSRFKQSSNYYSPYQVDLGWDFASDILKVLGPIYYDNSTIVARKLYDLAILSAENVIKQHPKDVRARLLYIDLLRSGGIVLFNLPVKDNVLEQLAISKKLSPKRQQVEYSEITFLAGTGEIDKALNMSKQLVKRDQKDNIAETYYTLARLYLFKHDVLKVAPVIDYALINGVHFSDPAHFIFIAEAYDRIGRFEEAMWWYLQAFKATKNKTFLQKATNLSKETQKPLPTSFNKIFNPSLTKDATLKDIF